MLYLITVLELTMLSMLCDIDAFPLYSLNAALLSEPVFFIAQGWKFKIEIGEKLNNFKVDLI